MRFARLALFVVASSLATPFLGVRPVHAAPPVVSEGTRVRVETSVPSQATADKARAVVEAALALAEARLPYKLPEGRKIVVHLHAEAEGYQDAVRVAGEERRGELSRSLMSTYESHVLMAPRSDAPYLALVDDLPELTRFHLALTTVTQLLRRAGAPSLEWWPAWYFEGLAETISFDVVSAQAVATSKEAPRPLIVDGALDFLRDASDAKRVLPVPRLLFADVVAITYARRMQAHWVGLFRVLEAEPEKLTKLHDSIRRLPPPPLPESEDLDFRSLSYSHACATRLYEIFGPAEALDAKLRAYAASVTPRWFDVLQWSQFAGEDLVCAAPADSTAVAISEAPAPGVPFSISCELKIYALGDNQGEIYLGYERRDDPRFIKLAFQPGFVTLRVSSENVWQERMTVRFKVDPTEITLGAFIPVKITVGNGLLRVDVRDKKLVEIPAPESMDLLHGRIGFGALRGLTVFRKIVVAPTPESKPTDGAGTPPK